MENNIIDIIEKTAIKAETGDIQTRAEALTTLGQLTKKLAMTALPLAAMLLGGSGRAMAAGQDAITDALNFALILEYLEKEYYTQGLSSGVITSADRPTFQAILNHETAHVTLLVSAINNLGGTPATSPTFDFTGHGPYSPFTDYQQFLALAQAFEDTGVRAYNGQAANLMANNDMLTAALQIHAVEARHAAIIRGLRRSHGYDTAKNWITGAQIGSLPAAFQPVYAGEDTAIQAGILTSTTVSMDAATEAFDEPLNPADVLSIVSPFVA